MTIGAPHDDLETHQYECLCGTIIPGSEAKNYRRVPDVKDGGEIQPYPYGSMKARPYNFENPQAGRPSPLHNAPSPGLRPFKARINRDAAESRAKLPWTGSVVFLGWMVVLPT